MVLQWYFIPTNRLDTLQGYLAIPNMGIVFAKNQIRPGLEYFADLDASIPSLETINCEVSDDDDDDVEGKFSDWEDRFSAINDHEPES